MKNFNSKKKSPRDDLFDELTARFDQGAFARSEDLCKNEKGLIFVDPSYSDEGLDIINKETLSCHPDFAILLEKYDAWIDQREDKIIIRLEGNPSLQIKRGFNRNYFLHSTE